MKKFLVLVTSALMLAFGLSAPAQATSPDTITVYWAMPTPDGGWASEPNNVTATWPQRFLGETPDGLACGEWAQGDTYRFKHQTDKDRVTALWADGLLTKTNGTPEDSGLHANVSPQWWFVQGPQWQDTDPNAPCFTGPEQPEAETKTVESDAVITCDTYTVESVTYEAVYTWSGTQWVLGEWVETVRASSQRPATDVEVVDLECHDDVPPLTPEPPVEPEVPAESEVPTTPEIPVVETPEVETPAQVITVEVPEQEVPYEEMERVDFLAETGVDSIVWFIVAGSAILIGFLALTYGRREREED